MGDDEVAYVEFDLQWLKYVLATTADHEFIEDWGRIMEEILIPVGSLKIEESSSEGQEQKRDRDEKEIPNSRKPKEPIKTSPKKQRKPQPEPAMKRMSSFDKKPRPSLLDRSFEQVIGRGRS